MAFCQKIRRDLRRLFREWCRTRKTAPATRPRWGGEAAPARPKLIGISKKTAVYPIATTAAIGDLVKYRMDKIEQEAAQMLSYIQSV